MAGIYVHIPFCTQRCIYCDFYFTTTLSDKPQFVQALLQEIDYYGNTFRRAEPIETVYFGGGTPSLLKIEELARILEALHRSFDISGVREFTFELNPEDVSLDYLRGLHSLGVNRLSIGTQSFFTEDLKFLNRSHTAEDAERAIIYAREAGFDNLTIDLIFALPEQPAEYWAANLEKAVNLNIPHLSTYSLTVEEKTVLHKQVQLGNISPLSEDETADRFRFTIEYLRSHGYDPYEISNYALPGRQAVHNRGYWEHKTYLGFGPSAHSFRGRQRWVNVPNVKRYTALLLSGHLPLNESETLTPDQLSDEYIYLRLRTEDGIDLDRLEQVYGVDLLTEKVDILAWLESEGLSRPIRGNRLSLTDEGRLLCDAITAKLIADD